MVTFRKFQPVINIILVFSLLLSIAPVQAFAAPKSEVQNPAPTERSLSSVDIPAALDHPFAISRLQSSYISNGETVVTYTITNNQAPTFSPDIADTATVTETTEILSMFSVTDDMNTLHNLTLAMTLTNGILVDPNGATQNGSTLTWSLPDIAPQQSAQVTVTLSSNPSGGSFIELDEGAVVSSDLWDIRISTQARPTVVIPDTLDSTLMHSTVDADINDADMLWIAAEFQQDPNAAFNYVKDFRYDPYTGSLRGTRGPSGAKLEMHWTNPPY